MDLSQILRTVLFQTGNDPEDLGDLQPFLTNAVNEGYDRLLMAWAGKHLHDDDCPPLRRDRDTPEGLPDWLHPYLADYASYKLCRGGSGQKQTRAQNFFAAFADGLGRARSATGRPRADLPQRFCNLPR